jgi:hypothetical protein
MPAYGITNYFEGGTKEQYDATVKPVHPDGGKGLPAGQTYHAAGPTDDGFPVVAIWDSKDTWEKLRDGTLVPALGSLDGALPGPPAEMDFEMHNEVRA